MPKAREPDAAVRSAEEPAEALTFFRGPNFSGRTAALRALALVDCSHADGVVGAYIGPEIHNALSGLASTVLDELELHASSAARLAPIVERLVDQLSLRELLFRNPFTLSGGEQALVAVAAALAMQPSRLALDCCFEQLDRDVREIVLAEVAGLAANADVAIADNRLEEYGRIPGSVLDAPFPGLGTRVTDTRIERVRSTCPPPNTQAGALSIERLTFTYHRKSKPVLIDVSVSLPAGHAYILEGRNGAGKSTLAKILCGALRPAGGKIRLGGELIVPWRRPGKTVAYHFQNPDLQLFSTSVAQEVSAGAARDSGAVPKRLEWLDSFGLTPVANEHPLDLPFVARKRIALAASFGMRTPWIILDEPTLGQDSATADAIAAMVASQVSAGRGAIVITHSKRFAEQVQGKRLLLAEGELHG